VAALGAVAWLVAVWLMIPAAPTTPTTPTLPVPNGYDDVLQAGREVHDAGMGNRLARLDIVTAGEATLRPHVEASREALATARRGLDRPFQVPVVYDINDMMGRQMGEWGEIRLLARVLFAEGRLAELQGRIDDATRAYLDLMRLGDAMGRRVPMMPYHISLAIGGMGLRGLRDLRTHLDADQCRRLIGVLQDQDHDRQPVAEVIRCEHQFMDANTSKSGLFIAAQYRLSGLLRSEKARVSASLTQDGRKEAVRRRLLVADLALRLYRLEHGEAPSGLDALVPTILRSVPIDPYSGKPLIYRKHAGGEALYSVGPDGDDDRLSPVLGGPYLDTSDGDVTLDSS
jgi:hypothetical protein